jgi:hypothetical protein
MRLNQQNKFARVILRVIDVCVSFYDYRLVRWDKKPFRKATQGEWRYGSLFMAFIPIFFLIFLENMKSFDAVVNSTIDGRHSLVWLYLGVFILVGGIGGALFAIAPKTPLYVSVPIAVVMWPVLGWFFWTHAI